MNIVTVMNFIRGCEPRDPNKDLLEAPIRQNELHKKYGFPNTFLLQYDAIIKPEFADFFKKEKDDNMELGVWIEIVRPLVEKVGIEWRGRPGYDWDWYVNPGFLQAYTQQQKVLLIDELMNKFKEVFGYYPQTAASWLLDAYSMNYMSEKYGIVCFAICREQLGVDAYTLWGGPYNQPYYPSKNNMLCPAQTEENKIKTPLFRLLGSEPIRNYWEKKYADSEECGGCPTMEPYWKYGQQEDYMKWFFETYFEKENMGLAYAQIGQENSFGWPGMKKGIELQYALVDEYNKAGKITLMKMSEAGEYVMKNYSDTPAQALVADTDATKDGYYRSIWYSKKDYRANIFLNRGKLSFRDIQKFDENYPERYQNEPCLENDAVYDTLPVVNERIWAKSIDEPESAMYFDGSYQLESTHRDGDTLTVTFTRDNGEKVSVIFGEKSIKINASSDLIWKFGTFTDYKLDGNKLCLTNNGYDYSVELKGTLTATNDGFVLSGDGKEIIF